MENVDKAMESRVWQRVQSRKPEEMPPMQRDNLKSCILAAQENAVACRNLSLQLIGKQWEPLRRLETEKYGDEVVCQWGMCVRKGGEDTWAKDW